MGTEEIDTRQALVWQIKEAFKRLGWSERKTAYRLYDATAPNYEDEVEAERFYQRFKKDLARKTTPLDKLHIYISIIESLPEYQEARFSFVKHVKDPILPDVIEEEMKAISKRLSDTLRKRRPPDPTPSE